MGEGVSFLTVGRMYGEPCDTECCAMYANLCQMTSVGTGRGTGEGDRRGGQVRGTGEGDRWGTGGGDG